MGGVAGIGHDEDDLHVHVEALLSARHRQEHLGQQARVEERAVQRARGIVDLVALAQRVERTALAGCSSRAMCSVSTTLAQYSVTGLNVDEIELPIKERDVERRVVDHQFRPAHEFEEFRRDLGKLRLVAQELGGQAMHLERAGLAVAPGVQEAVEIVAGQAPVDELNASDLDDAVTQFGLEAGGFGVDDYLAHFLNCVNGE